MVAFARQYDPLGNWTNFKQDTDADSDWELDQNRTHNKANEIAAITGEGVEVAHDAAGNMTVAPKPENWASHYHFIYDPWSRLVEVQTADQTKMVCAYEYDGLNRMISKWSYDEDAFSLSEWRHYYYSDKWQFLEERVADSYTGSYSGSGIPAMSGWGLSGSGVAGTFRLDRQFVWGLRYVNDLILRDRDTDTNGSLDERIYALQDPNWNVVAIANTSGTILKRFCYSAYGAPKYFTSNFSDSTAGYDWETLYCGYRYDYHTDSDVKWHIAGHRILLSHLGRWNRRDPILDDDPYRYCGNNPVVYVDPTGQFIFTGSALIIIAIGIGLGASGGCGRYEPAPPPTPLKPTPAPSQSTPPPSCNYFDVQTGNQTIPPDMAVVGGHIRRGITGGPVPGYQVVYRPCANACPGGTIHLVQALDDHGEGDHFDGEPIYDESITGEKLKAICKSISGEYPRYPRHDAGPLSVIDAPGAEAHLFNRTWQIDICAVCKQRQQDGTLKQTELGCMHMAWTDTRHTLSVNGANPIGQGENMGQIPAQNPTATWKGAVGNHDKWVERCKCK